MERLPYFILRKGKTFMIKPAPDSCHLLLDKFLRIRKSLLVNTRFIKEYSADRVVLDNGREVEISKNYRDHVRQHYISMLKGRRWE